MRFKGIPGKLLLVVLALLLFLPLFFLRSSPDSLSLSEAAACLGALLLYILLERFISRLQITNVLALTILLAASVFALAIYVAPSLNEDSVHVQDTEESFPVKTAGQHSQLSDSSVFSSNPEIQNSINKLAINGGEAIRNAGLFSGTGAVGRTLGAVGNVTSATAEVLIRTLYSGSNVAREDSIFLSEGVVDESGAFLRLIALIAAVTASIALLICLKYLVLVERRKGTLFWFRVLLITLLLRILYVSFGLEQLVQRAVSGFGNADILLSISPFYVFLMIFSILNGFRTKWIHYLNRWRKYLALSGSIVVLVLSQSVLQMYFSGRLTFSSLALGTLVGSVFTILLIFSALAALSILFFLPSARLVDRKLDQLRTLDGLGQSIYSTFDEEKIVSSSTTLGRRLSGADTCWAVKLDDGTFSRWKTPNSRKEKYIFPDEWHSEVRNQLEESGGSLLLNRYPSSSLSRIAGKKSSSPGSLLAAPLKVRKHTVGILYASTNRQFGFMNESTGLFETFARQIAAAIENARLMETELERQRYHEELAIARSIQEELLPGALPSVPGFDIAGISVQSRQVGGDYYDVIELPGSLCGIAIADVSGKGTAAALLMAALQSALHAVAPGMGANAGGVVERLNRLMSNRIPDDKFITFFYGVLDPLKGTLNYCCAGHDPPLLINGEGTVEKLAEGGLVLGIMEDAEYITATTHLSDNKRLLLYTDGITESMSVDDEEEFGVVRLADFVAEHETSRSSVILEKLLDTLETYRDQVPANDDMTLLMISCSDHTERAVTNGSSIED
ncbi:MAG: SpoIIE family protein phosphatase [Candidatus Aegiribacteria sp.]|nr:SpoIIE family protein phosphatase [Candidatus Aegiribacteria sp.]